MALSPEQGGIVVDNLSVTYRNGTKALEKVSLAIPPHSITALVGVNGAGKSTLFKALMGAIPVDSGKVTIKGVDAKTALKKNLIAYIPQAEEADWSFPVLVGDVVMMGRYGRMGFMRNPSPADHQAVITALDQVGMTEMITRQIGELSGGQQKRVFLARALAQKAEIILLDEPFTGIDVTTEDAIIAILKDLRDDGRLLLVSTHNLGSVPTFCDRSVLIKNTVICHGATETIFTAENLAHAFGGKLRHFILAGKDLHDDDDARRLTILTDDERPLVIYGEGDDHIEEKP